MNTTLAIQVLLHYKVRLAQDALRDPDNRGKVAACVADARLVDEALEGLGYKGLRS